MINYGLGVSLRRIKEGDLESLFKWRNDERIWRWCRQSSPLHWMGHLGWFKKQYEDPKLSMFSITLHSGLLIGCCGLTDIDLVNRRAEFSLYIEPGCHQNGLGTAALKSLFKHGFDDLGLNRIWGETYEGNPGFYIFTKKLGMTHEGTRVQHYYRNGEFVDCHLVSIGKDTFDSLFTEDNAIGCETRAS